MLALLLSLIPHLALAQVDHCQANWACKAVVNSAEATPVEKAFCKTAVAFLNTSITRNGRRFVEADNACMRAYIRIKDSEERKKSSTGPPKSGPFIF